MSRSQLCRKLLQFSGARIEYPMSQLGLSEESPCYSYFRCVGLNGLPQGQLPCRAARPHNDVPRSVPLRQLALSCFDNPDRSCEYSLGIAPLQNPINVASLAHQSALGNPPDSSRSKTALADC
jgi:hypothetical protein